MEKNKKKWIKGISMLFVICAFAVAGMFFVSIVTQPVIEDKQIEIIEAEYKREPTRILGDANPGENITGFFYAMIKNHSADPTAEYAQNITNTTGGNSNCYEWSDTVNTSMTGETPHTTAFDILFKVGISDEDGENASGWQDAWLWILLTCADLTIGADTNMTQFCIGNTTEYGWYHFYLNNAGSGYTVTEDQDFNLTSVKYYVQRIV